jgi:uncharacterized protein DUF4231
MSNEAMSRCDALISRYLTDKIKFHRQSNWAQVFALIFTAITPVLLVIPQPWQELTRVLATASTSIATVATGVLAAFRWQESFIRCGYTFHLLESEKFQFQRGSGQYAGLDEAAATKMFSARVEELVLNEVKDWRSQMVRPTDPPATDGMRAPLDK